MNGIGGYLVRRVLGALAVAAAFALVAWFNGAHAYTATSTAEGAPGIRYRAAQTLSGPYGTELFISAAAACAGSESLAWAQAAGGGSGYSSAGFDGTYCRYNRTTPAYSNFQAGPSVGTVASTCSTGYSNVGGSCVRYTCPNGGTLSGTSCTCGSGTIDTGSACVPGCLQNQRLSGSTCVCDAGAASQGVNSDLSPIPYTYEYGMTKEQWTAAPATLSGGCQGGCATTGSKSAFIGGTGYYAVSKTGATCSATNVIPSAGATAGAGASNEEANCLKNGGSPGTVSGVFTCLPKSTVDGERVGSPSTNTQTTTNPDGSRTERTTTQTPVTICQAGACTTSIVTTTTTTTFNTGGTPTGTTTETTTNTNPGGSGGGGSGPGGPCDPSKEQCGEGSKFGGSCASGFVCDGDAIQCAVAQLQHNRDCTLYEAAAGGPTLAEAASEFAAIGNGKATGTGRFEGTTASASTAFVTTERAYGAGSLSDWTVHGITIPLSQMNTPLTYLGYVTLVFCTLWGAQIMFSGRVGG